MNKEYWTVDELATYSGFAKVTIYKWVHERKMPFHKINGAVRFHIEQTKRFFESKEVKPRKVA